MSMTLAARASHSHHVSGPAPSRSKTPSSALHLAPLVWFGRRLKARPGTTLAHCVFAIAAGIILANALAFQRQDSPRSFIGDQAAAQAAAQMASQPRATQAPLPPAPPVRPAELASSPARLPAPQSAARDAAVTRDPIGDLIRSGQVTAAPDQRASAPPRQVVDTRPVLAAQRALNRVGVGQVKADGVFGEETRAALERFERERRIPVTRDLSPRTLRELTAASGIRME